jgi:hypothetical protein
MMSRTIYKTPYSALRWSNLEEWVQAAKIIRQRRCSYRTNEQRRCHVSALPQELIYICDCRATLDEALHLLTSGASGFGRPARGQRAEAVQTPLIVAARNRVAQLIRQEDMDSMPDGHNSLNR